MKKMLKSPKFQIFFGAILTALTVSFPKLWFLEWVSMIPIFTGFFAFCKDKKKKFSSYYFLGFATIYLYYFVIYHWLVELYPLDFAGLNAKESLIVILAGFLGLPSIQALFGGFIFLIFGIYFKSEHFRNSPILQVLCFSSLWVVFELSSTLGWFGVPWGRLALGQIEFLPALQSASLFGSYFVSFLILLVNGFLAAALFYRKREVLCVFLSVILLTANSAFGIYAMKKDSKTEDTVKVAVIQGNTDSHQKWSGRYDLIEQSYGTLVEKAASAGAEIILFPESVFPARWDYRTEIRDYFVRLAKENQVTIFAGVLRREGESEYNSVAMISPDGSVSDNYYSKRHLVPFGEYTPMEDFFETFVEPLADLSNLSGELTPGVGSHLFLTEWGNIGSLICFDSIYEELTLESVRDGAGLLFLSTNDSWFYDSKAVSMHLSQARLRAIETNRYLVRAANTGISAIITPDGELIANIDALTEGYAVREVSVRATQTLYTRIGNFFVYFLAFWVEIRLFGTIIVIILRKRARRRIELI